MSDMRTVLAHISDTHVGYRAYRATAPTGRNQREEDFLAAFDQACRDIVTRDVPLVVHSGDVADNPNISYRLVKELRDLARRVASIRPDGSRRQLVIVAGNHDLPGSKHETCFLELLADLPGVHVYTGGYQRLDLATVGDAPAELADIVVHAIPHDALADTDFDQVTPLDGRHNILVSHGTAGGTELYRRCVGREYAIPSDVLARDWSYGALGHWHRQGPVDVGDRISRVVPGSESRIWYAGSTENSGFGDLADHGEQRGYLLVALEPLARPGSDGPGAPRAEPMVEAITLPIRPMLRGEILDATGCDPDAITELLIDQLDQLDRQRGLTGAVIGQRVTGCDRSLWGLVDIARVRQRAARALHHDLRLIVDAAGRAPTITRDEPAGFAGFDHEIEQAAQRVVDAAHRTTSTTRAKQHLHARLNQAASSDRQPTDETGGETADETGARDGTGGAGADAPSGATLSL